MFLSLEQIHRLHAMGLQDHGGSPGIRDAGLIESALASAKNSALYGGGDHFDIAAAYAFHLAQAQAYLDGNKRVGAMAALVFLALQGYKRKPSIADQDRLYDAMIGMATRDVSKEDLAALLREMFIQ